MVPSLNLKLNSARTARVVFLDVTHKAVIILLILGAALWLLTQHHIAYKAGAFQGFIGLFFGATVDRIGPLIKTHRFV
jgi:Na+/phosphate symporter